MSDAVCAEHPDHHLPCSKCAGADRCPPSATCGHPNHGNPDHDCAPFLPTRSAARPDRHAVEVTVTTRIEVSPRLLAEAFAEMSDEGQAQFFIEVADVARGWGRDPHAQWFLAGRHLATCKCSTDDARDLVATIARGAARGPD